MKPGTVLRKKCTPWTIIAEGLPRLRESPMVRFDFSRGFNVVDNDVIVVLYPWYDGWDAVLVNSRIGVLPAATLASENTFEVISLPTD